MTGADVTAIREALGRALGRRLSHRDLGLALGLAPANAKDSARRWEDDAPTGPAAVALSFMRECTDIAISNPGCETQEDIEKMVRRLFMTRARDLGSTPSR